MIGTDPLSIAEAFPLELVLWGITGIAFTFFVIFSAILFWHWNLYSMGKYTTVSTFVVYLAVSTVFFLLLGLSALWYGLV